MAILIIFVKKKISTMRKLKSLLLAMFIILLNIDSQACTNFLVTKGASVDGSNFITYARQYSQAPILVLSARTTDDDKVTALDLGANDYVTKPFSTAELLARVRSALRNRRYSDQDGVFGDTFDVADLHIDFARRLVTLSGREVRLTQTEYNIVTVLAHHAGRVMTYAAIIRAVWGTTDEGSVKKLQVNLANIRKKLGERPGDRRYISNELGVGYRMISDGE